MSHASEPQHAMHQSAAWAAAAATVLTLHILGGVHGGTGAGCIRPDDSGEPFDVIVIGSGAAGLQAAWYLQRESSNLRSAVLEKGAEVGAFWQQFPRGGELISFNKRFNLYPDEEVALRW